MSAKPTPYAGRDLNWRVRVIGKSRDGEIDHTQIMQGFVARAGRPRPANKRQVRASCMQAHVFCSHPPEAETCGLPGNGRWLFWAFAASLDRSGRRFFSAAADRAHHHASHSTQFIVFNHTQCVTVLNQGGPCKTLVIRLEWHWTKVGNAATVLSLGRTRAPHCEDRA